MIQNSAEKIMATPTTGGKGVFPVNQKHVHGRNQCSPSQATKVGQAAKAGNTATHTQSLTRQGRVR